jgi:hypothetical protein
VNEVRYRKVIAAIGLVAGLGGGGVVAGAPSLVVGSTATAGVPTVCWDTATRKICGNDPVGPPPTWVGPPTPVTRPTGR